MMIKRKMTFPSVMIITVLSSENPCSSSSGGCSHLCLLRPNGYLCSCPDQLAPGDVCVNGCK